MSTEELEKKVIKHIDSRMEMQEKLFFKKVRGTLIFLFGAFGSMLIAAAILVITLKMDVSYLKKDVVTLMKESVKQDQFLNLQSLVFKALEEINNKNINDDLRSEKMIEKIHELHVEVERIKAGGGTRGVKKKEEIKTTSIDDITMPWEDNIN